MAIKITYYAHGTSTENEKGISSGLLDTELSNLGVRELANNWRVEARLGIYFGIGHD